MLRRVNSIFREQHELINSMKRRKLKKKQPLTPAVPFEEVRGREAVEDQAVQLERLADVQCEMRSAKVKPDVVDSKLKESSVQEVEFPRLPSLKLTIAQKSVRDFYSHADDSSDSDNSSVADAEMEPILARHVQQAHKRLVEALVADEGEERAVFEHQWDQHPDEYRLLFDPSLRPFEDSNGKLVTMKMMSTGRRLAEERDRQRFRRETALARKRARRAWEWDQYRLLDSAQVLPFVSSSGELISEATIMEKRAQARTDVKSGVQRVARRSTDRVEKCRAAKQLLEHSLLACRSSHNAQGLTLL